MGSASTLIPVRSRAVDVGAVFAAAAPTTLVFWLQLENAPALLAHSKMADEKEGATGMRFLAL